MVRLSLIAKFVACGITDADADPERPAIKDVRLTIKQVAPGRFYLVRALSRLLSRAGCLLALWLPRSLALSLSRSLAPSLSLPLVRACVLSLSRSDAGRIQMLYHDNEVHAKGRILITVPPSRILPVCTSESAP